jgi:hypothetical protein
MCGVTAGGRPDGKCFDVAGWLAPALGFGSASENSADGRTSTFATMDILYTFTMDTEIRYTMDSTRVKRQ